jgi:hypothetical protein
MSEEEKGAIVGSLYQSLARSNKEIRDQRGATLAEQMETAYRRNIEDIRYDIKELVRKRTNMYDFSPTNSQSLVLAKDVEAREILKQDSALSLEIRNMEIKLELAEKRYLELFGKVVNQ